MWSNRNKFSRELHDEAVSEYLSEITDEQAVCSDVGGDSDGEDLQNSSLRLGSTRFSGENSMIVDSDQKADDPLSTPSSETVNFPELLPDLADELIGSFCSRKDIGRPNHKITKEKNKENGRLLKRNFASAKGDHLPIKGSCRRCAYCSTKEKVRRTSIECRTCKVCLCLDCYVPFHDS